MLCRFTVVGAVGVDRAIIIALIKQRLKYLRVVHIGRSHHVGADELVLHIHANMVLVTVVTLALFLVSWFTVPECFFVHVCGAAPPTHPASCPA